jgi:hypothetical protein
MYKELQIPSSGELEDFSRELGSVKSLKALYLKTIREFETRTTSIKLNNWGV